MGEITMGGRIPRDSRRSTGKAVIYYRRGSPKNPAESASTSHFFVCLESSRVATKASLYLDRARLRSCDENRRKNDEGSRTIRAPDEGVGPVPGGPRAVDR